MNELAVQAANGTYSTSDREALQAEMEQLTTEIDRVAETTKFNETYLLKGANGVKSQYLEGHDAGLDYMTFVDGESKATLTIDLSPGDTVTIAGQAYHIKMAPTNGDDSVVNLQSQISSYSGPFNAGAQPVTVVVNGTTYILTKNTAGDAVFSAGTGSTYLPEELAAKIEDGTIVRIYGYNNDDELVALDYEDTQKNISEDDAKDLIRRSLIQANNVGVTDGQYSTIDATNDISPEGDGVWKFTIHKGQATVDNTLTFNLHVGSDSDMSNKINVNIEAMNASGLGIKDLNVADDSGISATYAIDAIANAIDQVSAQRSALGAIQNRLEHTINNLDNVVENTTAAESRIRDTDMAEEMVEYSKSNILAQAGQSMLAQANQSTQGVMNLLQ
jgi:flagellin